MRITVEVEVWYAESAAWDRMPFNALQVGMLFRRVAIDIKEVQEEGIIAVALATPVVHNGKLRVEAKNITGLKEAIETVQKNRTATKDI